MMKTRNLDANLILLDLDISFFQNLTSKDIFSMQAHEPDKSQPEQIISGEYPALKNAFIFFDRRMVNLWKTMQQLIVDGVVSNSLHPERMTELFFRFLHDDTIIRYNIILNGSGIVEERIWKGTKNNTLVRCFYREGTKQYAYINNKKVLIGTPLARNNSIVRYVPELQQLFENVVVKTNSIHLPQQNIYITSDDSVLVRYRTDQLWTCSRWSLEQLIGYRGLHKGNIVKWYQLGKIGHNIREYSNFNALDLKWEYKDD
jgi:hypothetical protein